MAATQYQVFCRYLNENVNHALTNQTETEWINAEELNDITKFYEENVTSYEDIKTRIINGTIRKDQLSVQELNIYDKCGRYEDVQDKIEKQKIVAEYCIVEPADSSTDANGRKKKAERDLELYSKVIQETAATNPKYDMVFIYDGIAYAESRNGLADYNSGSNNSKQIPYVYYERMKRVKLDPWFLFSTHASLNSAMIKAKELVKILGKDAVKIGKVVPLDQYIEIV